MFEDSRPLQIFLCHSSADKVAVRTLFEQLIEDNLDPWLAEENLLPGQLWEKMIPAAVRKSDVVLVCLTERAVTEAGYLQKEIKLALDVADEQPEGAIFVIPVKLEECSVPERLRHLQWVELFEEHGYERLIRALDERADRLRHDVSTVRTGNEQKKRGPIQLKLNEYAARLVSLFEAFDARNIHEEEGYVIVQLDLSSVFRRLEEPVLLFVTNTSTLKAIRLEDKAVTNVIPSKFSLLPIALSDYSKSVTQIVDKISVFAGQPIFAVQELFEPGDIHAIWKDVLLRHTDLALLSPFDISRSAAGSMFFGRQSLLLRLSRLQGCCAIVGSRRIGKSSLALKLRKELLNIGHLKFGGLRISRCSYVDVSAVGSNSERIWPVILHGFGLDPLMYRNYGRRLKYKSKYKYDFHVYDEAQVLDEIVSRFEGNLTILLDEVDHLIRDEAKSGWTFLDRLRAITDRGRARVILLGYETLLSAVGSDRFPLFGRGETILLGPLDRESVKNLVVIPLSELKIRLERESDTLAEIWRQTSGMPHLIQDVCSQMLVLASQAGKDSLTLSDLRVAFESSQPFQYFRRGVIGGDFPLAEAICCATILIVMKGQINVPDPTEVHVPLKQLISKLSKFGFTHNLNELELALRYLELRMILRPVDGAHELWTWVNLSRYETTRDHLFIVGENRYLADLLRKHEEGEWRARYKVLGILN